MPRWPAWIVGVALGKWVWDNVSAKTAGPVAIVLLAAYWGHRIATADGDFSSRGRRALAGARRILTEVGDAILGLLIVLPVLLAIGAVLSGRVPFWQVGAGVVALFAVAVIFIAYWSSRVITQPLRSFERTFRERERARRRLEPVLAELERNAVSTQHVEHVRVEAALDALYRERGLARPQIAWAASPPAFLRHVPGLSAEDLFSGAGGAPDSLLADASVWGPIWSAATPDLLLSPQLRANALAFGAESNVLHELVRETSWFWLDEKRAVVLERPEMIRVDAQGRLHSDRSAAVRFPDGWTAHALQGVAVPRAVVEDPAAVDPRIVLHEENTEVRRVLIERIGWDRVVRAAGIEPFAESEAGRLWRLRPRDDEPIMLLEVENATEEPDGSRRRYFLRVPPEMRSPREAAAWTFGLSALEYAPDAAS